MMRQAKARSVRINLSVAMGQDGSRALDSRLTRERIARQPPPRKACGVPSPQLMLQFGDHRWIAGPIHRRHVFDRRVDSKAMEERDEPTDRIRALSPDTTSAGGAVAGGKLAEVEIRFLHQQRSARSSTAAANPLRLDQQHAESRL